MPRSPSRGELLLFAASIALALTVGELGVRALGLAQAKPTGYAPVNTDRRRGRPLNSRGYRDDEHELAKPAGEKRLVAQGDSFAWGASVEFEDAWPQRLGRWLARRRKERWETVTLALPGLSCVDYAAQLPAEALAYQPDVIVTGYTLNDAESKQEMKERERGYKERDARLPGFFSRSALYRFVAGRVAATQESRERIAYHRSLYDDRNPGWIAARKALRDMGAICRENGVPWVVAVFPMFGNPLDESYPFSDIHAKVAQAAGEAGARVVDLLPAYRGLRWDLLVVNGYLDEHPNEIAHRIAADALLEALDDVLPWQRRR